MKNEPGKIKRIIARSRRASKKKGVSDGTEQMREPSEQGITDWSTENRAFVTAYNQLIAIEGLALEQYRVF